MKEIFENEEYERIVMEIVTDAGQARSCMLKAVHEARAGQFERADELAAQANDYLGKAHETQTCLLQNEIRGEHTPITLIMVHAQDHLMTAITVKELATELITEIKLRQGVNVC